MKANTLDANSNRLLDGISSQISLLTMHDNISHCTIPTDRQWNHLCPEKSYLNSIEKWWKFCAKHLDRILDNRMLMPIVCLICLRRAQSIPLFLLLFSVSLIFEAYIIVCLAWWCKFGYMHVIHFYWFDVYTMAVGKSSI